VIFTFLTIDRRSAAVLPLPVLAYQNASNTDTGNPPILYPTAFIISVLIMPMIRLTVLWAYVRWVVTGFTVHKVDVTTAQDQQTHKGNRLHVEIIADHGAPVKS